MLLSNVLDCNAPASYLTKRISLIYNFLAFFVAYYAVNSLKTIALLLIHMLIIRSQPN